MSRWLLTGGGGALAGELRAILRRHGHDVSAPNRAELDINDGDSIGRQIVGHDVVVNCAAYTRVDQAETDESGAFAVNAVGPALLARACRRSGARLIHVSTDYVFDGLARTPYDEEDIPRPQSAYGRTKAAGEWAVRAENPDALIVRTGWLYGEHGRNFVSTMLTLAARPGSVRVVTDQTGAPTWTRDLGDAVIRLVENAAPAGFWHGTSAGQTTWYEVARTVFTLAGEDPDRVEAITSDQFAAAAPRPAYSVLGHRKWLASGIDPLPPWRDSLTTATMQLLATSGTSRG